MAVTKRWRRDLTVETPTQHIMVSMNLSYNCKKSYIVTIHNITTFISIKVREGHMPCAVRP